MIIIAPLDAHNNEECMKKALLIAISSAIITLSPIAFAYDNGDGTHTVETYTKKDGTTVQEHRAGNPGSGIHCSDNICS